MKNQLLFAIFMGAFLFGTPFTTATKAAVEVVDNDFQNIAISVTGNTLHVTGANGLVLQIFNVAGVGVSNFKVEGNDKHYELNLHHGCYIVKVGKTVRKISIS